MHFFRLVRTGNLFILALSQLILSVIVIRPLLSTFAMDTGVSAISVFLLVSTSVLQAAGGYAINDYFDRESDRINKKRTPSYQPQTQKRIHLYLTLASLLTGSILAFRVESIALAVVFFIVPLSLWYYSSWLKRLPFVGNLLVALLTALSIVLTGLVPLLELRTLYGATIFASSIPLEVMKITLFFSLFAFSLTLVRELIKDIEDMPGDRHSGYRTLPIAVGLTTTRSIVIALLVFTIPVIFIFTQHLLPFDNLTAGIYMTVLVVVPLVVTLLRILKASEQAHYHKASVLIKASMIGGLGYSLLYNWQLAQYYPINSCLF